MGRNLEFDSQVLELNSRFLPLCLGYSLPKKEKEFLTNALASVVHVPRFTRHCWRPCRLLSLDLICTYLQMGPSE